MRLVAPLRRTDFARLLAGGTISLLGDGIYVVAIAFQVLALTNTTTALSLVLLAWAVGLVACLPAAGVLIDRLDRRVVLVAADGAQLVATAALAVLSLSGAIELWHCFVVAFVIGVGTAFVKPASSALVPAVVPKDELVAASALLESAEQGATMFIGPGIGGLLVAAAGPGGALLADAATFAISMALIVAIRSPTRARERAQESFLREIRTGLDYVRSEPWLWATLVAASLGVMAAIGPIDVLLPYIVKNEWGGGAQDFGLLIALSGASGLVATLVVGQRGLPRRPVTMMFLAWGASTTAIAGFGLVDSVVAAIPFEIALGVGFTGEVIWFSLVRTRVPDELLGRVSSLDWFISGGLLPVSFALTGPIASAIGAQTTLVCSGALAGLAFLVLYFAVPGLREPRGHTSSNGETGHLASKSRLG
jgi:DHA3 family tetracycline resistance protein-like MFS transporter